MADPAGREVDVVVAGAGGAGLTAALAAADRGRTVLIVERRPTFRHDCNTAMSTGMIPAAGSGWQDQAGVEDSPDAFLADIERKTAGTADATVARALTTVAPELVQWLAARCGLRLELVTDFAYPGHSAYRCHAVSGRSGQTLMRALLSAAESHPNITFMVGTRLTDVILRAGGGAAAVIANPDRAEESVSAAGVILACNGFGAARERVSELIPEIAGGLYYGGPGSVGDALAIGERLGADLACMDAYQGHGSVAVPHGILVTWAAIMNGAFIVNRLGARFADESQGYSEFARKIAGQPESAGWVVLDKQINQACLSFTDHQRLNGAGAVRWADDVPGLAGVTGCRPEVLAATMTATARYAAGQACDPFSRRHWARPLHPPYAAIQVAGALFHTQGGLAVDACGRVLRGGLPLPGLFAAGGAAVGISGAGADGYLAGNGLLAALGLGLLAGRAICAE
jgi:fumarate reductase flavoprotein subunit